MAAFDVYVNSSNFEGVSLTILEAMASGLPVVATRVGGTPEVVLHDETGLLVEPSQPAELTAVLARLVDAVDVRARLGHAARRRVEQHFSIQRMVAEYQRIYRSLGVN